MPKKTAEDAPSTLPAHAGRIWASTFNNAWGKACKKEGDRRDECAARIAWSAVKRDYKKGKGKMWVKKSAAEIEAEMVLSQPLSLESLAKTDPHAYLDFIVVKASSSDGQMRWVARASDTLKDDYDTRMSRELFASFIARARVMGELPYLSVAHYGALGGDGVAGDTKSMWIDGVVFKAKGVFRPTSLGRALFGTIIQERNDPSVSQDKRVRMSIGFLDLKHSHGQFMFTRRSLDDVCPVCASGIRPTVYLDGQLVHFGATRVPVNRRTTMEAGGHVMMSDQGVTRRDDAASIVGEGLADELERLTLEKIEELSDISQTQAMVVKADVEDPPEQATEKDKTAQEHRSRRYGITIRGDGRVTIPKREQEMEAQEGDFADPVNFRYPIWLTKPTTDLSDVQLKQVRSASSQFKGHKDQYDSKSCERVRTRIERALKKHSVGEFKKEDRSEVAYPSDWGGPYRPFGGATTLADASEYIVAQKINTAIVDEVDMFQSVVNNILTADQDAVPDRGGALKAAADEFRTRIGDFAVPEDESGDSEEEGTDIVKQSATVQAAAPVVAPVVAPAAPVAPVAAPAPAPAAPAAPVAAEVVRGGEEVTAVLKPVVEAIAEFQKMVLGYLEDTGLGPDERLKQIQPELEKMSKTIVETARIAPLTPESAMVTAFRAALATELAPVAQGLQMLLAKLGPTPGTQGPTRKTYSHVASAPAASPEKVSPIDVLARRSVVGSPKQE